MYRVVWNDNYGLTEPGYYRNAAPVDNRPTEVDADRYEVQTGEQGQYLTVINFFKEDRQVASFFNLPVAILFVANIPQ